KLFHLPLAVLEKYFDLFLGPAGRCQTRGSGCAAFSCFLWSVSLHHPNNCRKGILANSKKRTQLLGGYRGVADHLSLLHFDVGFLRDLVTNGSPTRHVLSPVRTMIFEGMAREFRHSGNNIFNSASFCKNKDGSWPQFPHGGDGKSHFGIPSFVEPW